VVTDAPLIISNSFIRSQFISTQNGWYMQTKGKSISTAETKLKNLTENWRIASQCAFAENAVTPLLRNGLLMFTCPFYDARPLHLVCEAHVRTTYQGPEKKSRRRRVFAIDILEIRLKSMSSNISAKLCKSIGEKWSDITRLSPDHKILWSRT